MDGIDNHALVLLLFGICTSGGLMILAVKQISLVVEQALGRFAYNNNNNGEQHPINQSNELVRNDVLQCPICLERLRFAVETSCGHAYCGECLREWWQQNSRIRIICALDRNLVSFLVPSHSIRAQCDNEANQVNRQGASRAEIDRFVREYNMLPEILSLGSIYQALRVGLLSIGQLSFQDRYVLSQTILYLIIFLFYFLSPIDFLPETFFGLVGLIDDLLILFVIVYNVGIMIRNSQ